MTTTLVPDRYPLASWAATPNFWTAHNGRRAVVLHIAQGGFLSSVKHMRENGTSSHFIVSKSGAVVQMVDVNDSAWANGISFAGGVWHCPHKHIVEPTWDYGLADHLNPNSTTISVEHEGMSGEPPTPAQLASTVALLQWLGKLFPSLLPYRAGETLIRHANLDPTDKAFCPGRGYDLDAIAARANAQIASTVDEWLRVYSLRGVELPVEQRDWAVPQLYRANYAKLGACLVPERYVSALLSVAIFQRGIIYYVPTTNTAHVALVEGLS